MWPGAKRALRSRQLAPAASIARGRAPTSRQTTALEATKGSRAPLLPWGILRPRSAEGLLQIYRRKLVTGQQIPFWSRVCFSTGTRCLLAAGAERRDPSPPAQGQVLLPGKRQPGAQSGSFQLTVWPAGQCTDDLPSSGWELIRACREAAQGLQAAGGSTRPLEGMDPAP